MKPLLVLCALLAGASPAARKPNIIFILADDLGYGDLGCYGQKKLRTPNIDRLAAEGMRFTQHYAGSTVCAPSRCSLMTGLHMGHAFIRGNGNDNLRPEDVTVAELLKEAGYATGLVGKWGLGHEGSTGVPTKQGFDSFFGYLDQTHAHNYYPSFLLRNEERVKLKNVVPKEGKEGQGVASERVEYSHDLFADEALAFVERNKEKPFFLYLAFTLPHANNEGGAAGRGTEVPDFGPYADRDWPEVEKGFAGMVHRLDRDVGRLMAKLVELGIDRDTVVFFSSDNGPHHEGNHSAEFFDSNGPVRGTKRELTDGGIRVPLMVRWPGTVKAGSVSDHVGAFWDVMPTLGEIGGGKAPAGIDGRSFLSALKGEAQAPPEFLYWAFYERGGAQAVRMGPWKAVQQPMTTAVRLYDVTKDPGEESDVAAANPGVVDRAVQLMKKAYVPSQRWVLPAGEVRRK